MDKEPAMIPEPSVAMMFCTASFTRILRLGSERVLNIRVILSWYLPPLLLTLLLDLFWVFRVVKVKEFMALQCLTRTGVLRSSCLGLSSVPVTQMIVHMTGDPKTPVTIFPT